jgi:hypothetical protein
MKSPRLTLVLSGTIASMIAGSACIFMLPFVGFGLDTIPIIMGWIPSMAVVGASLGYAVGYLRRPRFWVFVLPPLGWVIGMLVASAALPTKVAFTNQVFIWGTIMGLVAGLLLWLIAQLVDSRSQ